MITLPLVKTSPLAGVYQRYPVQCQTIAGWAMAQHFGHPQREADHYRQQSVLADWSHIGKLLLSGPAAAAAAASLWPPDQRPAQPSRPLGSHATADLALLQLTATDCLVLCHPDLTPSLTTQLAAAVPCTDLTGALAGLVLAGPRRGEVWERSTALDVTPGPGSVGAVKQTTVHAIRCTIFQMVHADLILPPRALAESLFDALLDVGLPVGMRPAGLSTLPVAFTQAEGRQDQWTT